MVISALGNIPQATPINSVTPFTYRDNETYLTLLEKLRVNVNTTIDYINDVSVYNSAEINLAITNLTAELNALLADSLTEINAATATLTEMETTLGVLQDTLTATETTVNDATAQLTALLASIDDDLAARYTKAEADTLLNGKVSKNSIVRNVKDYGALGNGVADDSPAIQAAYDACVSGDTIYFPPTSSGANYKMVTGIVITKANIRIASAGRDYATIIKGATPNMIMFTVKAPSFVMDEINLTGEGATNGVGATITGLDLFGDNDGNVDCSIRNSLLIGLATGAKVRGRNALFSGTFFTSCLNGIIFDGKDAVYHTGPNADSNRGNLVQQCRFHNIGNSAVTDAAITFTTTSKILHATVEDNFFDSNGFGRHIVAIGTVANPLKQLRFAGNKHMECNADVYALTYCNFATISNAQINGNSGVGAAYGNAFVINNCDTVTIDNSLVVQAGKSGVVARNNVRLFCKGVVVSSSGIDPSNVGNGFDVDSTNTACAFQDCRVVSCDGWGFTGSPVSCVMNGCEFISNTLGTMDSLTLVNRAAKGLNSYTEGRFGRYDDVASQAYDLSAGVAKAIATVTAGSSFGSFILEVTYSARDGVGDCYVANRYIVRVENGAPVVTLIGVANVARVAITTAASGTNGITISLNSTAASSGVATVRAVSGGAANTTNQRGVTVAMAVN